MTPAERKRLERDRRKAGLVRLELWVPGDKLVAAMAAVDAVVEGSTQGWQPISTAPRKRGQRIVGWCTFPAEAREVKCHIPLDMPESDPDWYYQNFKQNVTHWWDFGAGQTMPPQDVQE